MRNAPLRIVSYNIRKTRGLDQRRDPGRILDVINSLDGDIVVLQEADRRLGQRRAALEKDFVEANSDYAVAPVATNEVSIGWHGNAVLLRKGLGVGRISRLDLPGIEPRGALKLELKAPVRFSLVATHLGLRRKDRQKQQKVISEAMSGEVPTVLAGDLNEWSSTTGLEVLQASLSLLAPGRSFHARRPVAALDRFGTSKDVDVRDAGVEDGSRAARASDHLPIWADLAIG